MEKKLQWNHVQSMPSRKCYKTCLGETWYITDLSTNYCYYVNNNSYNNLDSVTEMWASFKTLLWSAIGCNSPSAQCNKQFSPSAISSWEKVLTPWSWWWCPFLKCMIVECSVHWGKERERERRRKNRENVIIKEKEKRHGAKFRKQVGFQMSVECRWGICFPDCLWHGIPEHGSIGKSTNYSSFSTMQACKADQ